MQAGQNLGRVLGFKSYLHRRRLPDNAGDKDNYSDMNSTCIGHLGRCDTDRIFSISVASPKVAKARTYSVAVADVFAEITLPM
jgi:hypothetical protein